MATHLVRSAADALGGIPIALDRFASSIDRWFSEPGAVKWVGERSLLAFVLPLPTYFFIAYGPSALGPGPKWRGWTPLLLVFVGVVSQAVYFRFVRKRLMAWLHFSMVVVLAMASFWGAAPAASQHSAAMYRHPFGWIAVLLLGAAIPLSNLFRHSGLFNVPDGLVRQFAAAIVPSELVKARARPRHLTLPDLLRALIVCIVQTPIHILIVPAFAVVLANSTSVLAALLVSTMVSWLLFGLAEYDPERDTLVRLVTNLFFSGATFFISITVLVLAVMRLAGVSYVTAVLDASPRMIIVSYVAAAYGLLWFYDFWVRQRVLDQLAGLPYRRSTPEAAGLPLRRYGGGRIAVMDGDRIRVFTASELLTSIAETRTGTATRPSLEEASRTNQRLLALFATTTVVTTALVAIGVLWARASEPRPLIEAGDAAGRVDLRESLREASPQAPALLVAGSGGGTRAALWTTAVLHGISRVGQLHRVVLVSGVSGGSAALAYFGRYRTELLQSPDASRWQQMQETMAMPYIADVLAGAGEWRLATGTPLGELLAESFGREFDRSSTESADTAIGGISDLGVIFNASICSDTASERGAVGHAGGRLLFTNLRTRFTASPTQTMLGWNLEWPLIAVRDASVSLFAAVAASANFPPVFPNALVRLYGDNRSRDVWITDGGVIENRGIIELLLALNEALLQWRKDIPVADIRIVVAEASAIGVDHATDRGVGAALQASAQLANGVIGELLASVSSRHRQLTNRRDGVRIVYLPMPSSLRSSGTFGTHWMTPDQIPFGIHRKGEERMSLVRLRSATVQKIIDALMSPHFTGEFLRSELGANADEVLAELNGSGWNVLSKAIVAPVSAQ